VAPDVKSAISIRPATPDDAEDCGEICYRAFAAINSHHNFPCDFPGPEVAVGVLSRLFPHPGCYCVVAETESGIVGSNCVDERAVIAGVGPITVDPNSQNAGVGRRLMDAVMDHARAGGAVGIRLVQAAFHNRSLSLYTRLGFDIREPLSCLQGRTHVREIHGCMVRSATRNDLDACNALSRNVHGFDRGPELSEATDLTMALVVEREGRITGYTSGLAFFGHSVGESNVDLQALIASVESFGGPGILVPSRNSALLRWCLDNGLRIVQPMTLMSVGLYNEPAGAWLPSIMF
jgi:GNAT superfamily N-acetyltransferase